MAWYLVAEMLPVEEVEDSPTREFSRGTGFESPNCDFWVYGPVIDYNDLATDYERLLDEGYIVEWIIDYTCDRETDAI
jgi:hypothetical protein